MDKIIQKDSKIKITSRLFEYDEKTGSCLFDTDSGGGEQSVFSTDCTIRDDGKKFEIIYEESELTGMEGSVTKVTFEHGMENLVSILRDGSVNTALVFEEGKRNMCVYETPYMPIELCVDTSLLKNSLSIDGGMLEVDYIVECGGVKTERTQIKLEIDG